MKVYILIFIFLGLIRLGFAQVEQIDELVSPEELYDSGLYLEVIKLLRGWRTQEERFLYARALHRASFSEEALKEFTNIKERIIKKDDFYRKVWLNEIEALVNCQRYAEAFEEYKDYIKEYPIPYQIFYKLAKYYHSDTDKLKKLYELTLIDKTLIDKEESYINAHLYSCLGMIYYTEKNYKKAITYFKKAQVLSNYLPTATTAAVILYLADAYLQEMDYDNAHSLLLDIFSSDSKRTVIKEVEDRLMFLLGFLEVQRGNYSSALEYLLSVKNTDIVSEDKLKYLIGYVYLQLFDFISAIKYLQEAYINLTDTKLKEKTLVYLFLAQIQLGYLELAEKTLSLIQNDKYKITYSLLLADSFYQKLDFTNAVKYYKIFLQEPRAKFMSAICYWYLGMKEKAIDTLHELLQEQKKDYLQYLACYWLGYIYYKELDFKQAYKYFKLASSCEKLSRWALYYAGCSSFNLKDYNLAIENFRKSSLPQGEYWIATIHYKKGELEKAKNIYYKLLKTKELEDKEYKALVLYYLGFCYFKEGRYLTSCEYFKKIMDEYKEYKNIYERAVYMLGDCYYNLGDYEHARNYYNLLGTDEALYKIAYSYYLEGKISKAIDILKSRDVISFRKKLGSIYEQQKAFDLAAKEYEKLANILPKDHTLRLDMGRCLMEMKEYKEAISAFQEARNLTEDKDLIAEIQFKIALCYYYMKDYKNAYKEFKLLQRQAYKLDREDLIQEAEFYLEDIKNYL